MRLIRLKVHILSALFVFMPPVLANDASPATIVIDKNTTLTNLSPLLRKRIMPGASSAEMLALLKRQPRLVLNGATLLVDPPASGSSQTLSLSRLELRNGARIVTNGVNLEINALLFVPFSGEIISFEKAHGMTATTAPDQTNGASGLGAGTLVLNGSLSNSEVLEVSLYGQDGQGGGKGNDGPVGAAGTRGDNGADHLLDCARGGGNGGNGAQGGPGGKGGTGGNGGDGGLLILRGDLAAQRMQVHFVASGGKGGDGGSPGNGGPGGPGGQGGNGTFYCRSGSAGSNGAQGILGDQGRKGEDGANGHITAD